MPFIYKRILLLQCFCISLIIFSIESNVNRQKQLTIISNIHFKDWRLSLRAKSLLSRILPLPDDWNLTRKGPVKICTEGRDTVSHAAKELESF